MAVAPIHGLDVASIGVAPPRQSEAAGEGAFTKLIDQLLSGAGQESALADQAVQDLASGKADNIHDVMLAVARADLSFRMILEIRNRLTEAFQEIMRMQV